jgi:phosphatidylinositol alpha-1,6-mannosyltransferase
MSPADYVSEEEVAAFDKEANFSIIRFKRFGSLKTYLNRLKIVFQFININRVKNIILTGKFSLWVGLFIKYIYPDIRTIAILHGSEVNLKNKLLRKFTHHAINSADEIVAVSAFTRSILPNFIKESRSIYVIPNGIESALINTSIGNSTVDLVGCPCLLTVGHVTQRKGQHRVVKALPNLVKHYPHIHYHMVGTPNTKKEIEELARELSVEKYITFHNRVKQHEDLVNYYHACDIFMLLSENQADGDVEGFGIVALEANGLGKPVIGARNCGIEDAIQHDFSGYLVDGNNSTDILKAVQNCLLHKERLAITTKEWANQHNWEAIVKQYIPILNA